MHVIKDDQRLLFQTGYWESPLQNYPQEVTFVIKDWFGRFT